MIVFLYHSSPTDVHLLIYGDQQSSVGKVAFFRRVGISLGFGIINHWQQDLSLVSCRQYIAVLTWLCIQAYNEFFPFIFWVVHEEVWMAMAWNCFMLIISFIFVLCVFPVCALLLLTFFAIKHEPAFSLVNHSGTKMKKNTLLWCKFLKNILEI